MTGPFRPLHAAALAAMAWLAGPCHSQAAASTTAMSATAASKEVAKPVAKVWFTCRSTDSAVDFVATEPAADQTKEQMRPIDANRCVDSK